jgi:hypothetical protein
MTMNELPITLTVEERDYLRELLEHTLKDIRGEEHRTRVLSYLFVFDIAGANSECLFTRFNGIEPPLVYILDDLIEVR